MNVHNNNLLSHHSMDVTTNQFNSLLWKTTIKLKLLADQQRLQNQSFMTVVNICNSTTLNDQTIIKMFVHIFVYCISANHI